MEIVLEIENHEISPATAKKFETFRKTYLNLLSDFEHLSLSNFVSNVIDKFNIKSAYSSESEEDFDRILNINTFLLAVQEFEENNKNGTLLDFLESVTLVSDIDTMDNENNAVTVATIHSVKGLEFKYVFIVGLEEKIFPISRAYNNSEDMEEERRLMYVAITRAKENLMLSRCKTRFLYGKREYQIDSRFLKELNLVQQKEFVSPQLSTPSFSNSYFKTNFEVENVANKTTTYSHSPFQTSQPTKYSEYVKSNPKPKATHNVGEKVSHPKFGNGVVEKIDGEFIEINFEKIGTKTLLLEIAPLTKID